MSGESRRRGLSLPSWLSWLLLALLVILAIAEAWFWKAVTPTTPGGFYTPPDPLPAAAPGTIIRREAISGNLPKGAVAWRVLYVSTGVGGKPVVVSGVIVAPQDKGTEPHPIVAWAHGTIGVVPACGTSQGANPFKLIPAADLLISQGFVIAANDYPGLGTPGVHPYLDGPVEAASVLDSVRAARSMDLNVGDQFVVWGHSQGGHAAIWTAQQAASYAPELKLLGVAAAAPATDLEGILEYGLKTPIGGILTAETLYAWANNYPDAEMSKVVKPELLPQVEKLAQLCITTPLALALVSKPTPSEFLSADPFITEPYRTIVANNTPHEAIKVPILLAHGTADEVIPFDGSVAYAKTQCGDGQKVLFMRYPGDNHFAVINTSAVATVGWIQDRFAGRPPGSNCGQ